MRATRVGFYSTALVVALCASLVVQAEDASAEGASTITAEGTNTQGTVTEGSTTEGTATERTGAGGAGPPAYIGTLTLGECVRRALEHGFTMEIERNTLAIAREDIPVARSAFRPIVTASAAKSVIHAPAGSGLPQATSHDFGSAVGISQRLQTGADVGLDFALNHSRFDATLVPLNPAYGSDLTLTARQPLLKGFGTTVNRLQIRRAEISSDSAARTYRSRALDLIQSTEVAYFALTGAREQLTVFGNSVRLAQKLQQEAEGREQAGMSTHLDVLQAEVGVSNANRNLIQARSVLRDSEDALLALMGRFEFDSALGATRFDEGPPAADPARRELSSDLPQPALSPDQPQLNSSYERAKASNPELQNARAALDLSEINLRAADDDLKPSLNLDLALGLNGTNETRGGAFNDVFAREGDFWQAGLSVTYPIGRVREKARARQARAAVNRERLTISSLEQQILVDVRRAVRAVETQTESVKLAAQAADLSQRQYDREIARFQAGLTTSRRVLEAQTDLETARVAHVQARLDLQNALATLHRLEASAPDRYGIDLAALSAGDGMAGSQ